MSTWLARLQPREQRAVGGLALALLVFLLLQFAVFPMIDSAAKTSAQLPLKEKKLHKYRRMVSMIGSAETDWNALEQRLHQSEKGLLDSRTAALASAELQDRVKQLLAQQGIEARISFLAVRALPPADSGYSSVPLSLAFECPVDQLANLLMSLQASGKTVAVDTITVEALPMRGDKPRKLLSVRMAIHALIFSEPAPQAAFAGHPHGWLIKAGDHA
jgi:type II secretion system (T2SS) protein M